MRDEDQILIDIGVGRDEATIYNSLLERGSLKASELAKWTGINRTLVYKALENLESMGAVAKNDATSKVALYTALHPQAFADTLAAKRQAMERSANNFQLSLGLLSSKFNLLSGKPNVQFFEGIEGAKRAVFDSLTAKTEVLTLLDTEVLDKTFADINAEYVKRRLATGIKKRIISTDTPESRSLASKDDTTLTAQRFVQSTSFAGTVVHIYDNKVCFATLDKQKTIATIVEDANISLMFKNIFEFMWRNADPL